MKQLGKIEGMVYEATLHEGSRIYRVFQNEKLLVECNQKELPLIPRRFMDEGLNDIANDMIASLPNLSWKTCAICGEEFISATARDNACTCSKECRQKRHALSKKGELYRAKPAKVNVGAKARELGISYGQYRAIQYMKAQKMKNLPEIAKYVD